MSKKVLPAPCPQPRRSAGNKEVITYCGGRRIELWLGDRFIVVICEICDAPSPVAVA